MQTISTNTVFRYPVHPNCTQITHVKATFTFICSDCGALHRADKAAASTEEKERV